MKQALRLLSRFFLTTLLLILVLGALAVLFRYVTGFDPGQASSPTVLMQLLVALREVFIVSVCAGAASAIFATIRSTDRPFLPLLALSVVWTVALVLASAFWPQARAAELSHVVRIPEDRVVRISGTHVYSPQVVASDVSPVFVHQPGIRPGSQVLPRAVVSADSKTISFPGSNQDPLNLAEMEAAYPAMVSPPDRLRGLMRDVAAVNTLLLRSDSPYAADDSRAAETDITAVPERNSSLLLVLALAVFLLSCWTPARLTRWPLFNALIVFLCIRGAFWLIDSVYFGGLGELLATVVRPDQLGLVTSGALFFVALVFGVTLFLLSPLSNWKREMGSV